MNIAILNECFLTDNHLQKLKTLGTVTTTLNTSTPQEAIERLKDVDVAIVDGILFPAHAEVLKSTNNLKLLVLNTTGYDSVDLDAAKEKGIKVANAAGYATEAVAEQTIALMLGVARKIRMQDKFVRENPSPIDPGHREHHQLLGFELKSKTLGIVGLGSIGCRVAEIASALGMNVIAYNRSPKEISCIQKQVTLEELLKESDVVSLHLALSSGTESLITEKELALMKPSAVIINTARAKIVDEQALYFALVNKTIAGAGLDVLEDWSASDPMLKLDTVILSPHCAFFTKEALHNLADTLVNTVESFIQGTPKNIVNP